LFSDITLTPKCIKIRELIKKIRGDRHLKAHLEAVILHKSLSLQNEKNTLICAALWAGGTLSL